MKLIPSSFFLIYCKHKVKQECRNSLILINSLWTEVDLPLSLCFLIIVKTHENLMTIRPNSTLETFIFQRESSLNFTLFIPSSAHLPLIASTCLRGTSAYPRLLLPAGAAVSQHLPIFAQVIASPVNQDYSSPVLPRCSVSYDFQGAV